MNQRKMVNYIVREGKCLQYPGRELSLEEKKQRLYHYTSFNSFVRIWLTQTLKFGVVTDMNDMFEHNFSSQCHSINAIKHLNSYHEEKKKYKQISLTMDYDSYTQGCMSPMMWGLYGDKGKGVCIEFDYIKLMKHLKRGMLHDAICYTPQLPEPPVITKEAASDWEAFFESKQKELLFTKHDCWSKENEYRIVSKKKDDYLGSAELISSHRQRVADVDPHSDDNDEKPPDFGQGKTKFPQELHHVFDEVAHSRPASCCIWKLGSYVIGSIDSLASTE